MKVLVLGATGYIGGAVAHALVRDGHDVSGLTRSDHKAQQLRHRGVAPWIGSLFDRQIILDAAKSVDAVVNAADSDNPYAVTALLEAVSGSQKRIVHTSGSSIVGDRAGGTLGEAIYDEASRPVARVEKRGRTAIDDAIRAGAQNGVVICPRVRTRLQQPGARQTGPRTGLAAAADPLPPRCYIVCRPGRRCRSQAGV